MAKVGATIQGFTGGILSPEIQGRIDFNKTQLGLADAENISISPAGAASHRVGTGFIAPCKFHDKKSVLLKFGSTRQAVYAIECGENYMRFFRDGAAVVTGFAVSNDVSQTLTTVANQDYIITVDVGTNDCQVNVGTTSGGAQILSKRLRAGTGRTIEFKATGTITYLSFAQIDGNSFTIANASGNQPVEVTTTYAEDDLSTIRYVQQGESLYLVHPSYPPKVLKRTNDTTWSFTDMTFNPNASNVQTLTLSAASRPSVPRDFKWLYTVSAIYEDENGNEVESLPGTRALVNGDIEISDRIITVTFTAINELAQKVKRYNVYRKGGGEFYLVNVIEAIGNADATRSYTFKDSGLSANESKSIIKEFNYFNSENKYPIACGIHNQRLVLGGTNHQTDRIWFSRVGDYENFTKTPILAKDEGFSRVLASGGINRIKHLQSVDDLICVTDGKIWRIRGNSNDDINAFIESSVGGGEARPIASRKSMLFIESNENTVSDFIYRERVNGYDGDRLDILSRSLFRNRKVIDMTFQDSPDGLLHTVLDNGRMPVITYLKNQDVYAWSYYKTQGNFERAVSLDRDVTDDTYVITKRIINGQTRRFIELFKYGAQNAENQNDYWYVDSGIRRIGPATQIVCGLDHLSGHRVRVYADGNDLNEFIVDSDGCVDLGKPYSNILVGLSYNSVIKLIPVEIQAREGGTSIGQSRRITTVTMSILNTRGFFFSSTGEKYDERKTTDSSYIGAPIPDETSRVKFDVSSSMEREATVFVGQRRPLPFTVLNITLSINFGDK